MGKTLTELRKFNRDRRARQRAAARTAGVPPLAKVSSAIAEANSFAMRTGVNIAGRQIMIDSGLVMTTAVSILVDRWGYDRDRSAQAVAHLLHPRPEHTWPGYVPSHAKSPTPGI